mgnify:FL=1|tara:strand:- start:499 stop:837 length:339 start_codon:yes stop_codon:yes gene_type:complete
MFKMKLIISATVFISFLIITSTIKNKTRVIEKNISNLNKKILFIVKDINEAQLDFHYLTSPAEIEKKLSMIGFYEYQPIKYSNIFFDISDFTKIHNKVSNLKNLNEKKIQKK